MNIGVPKERRPFEFRVGSTPTGIRLLTEKGATCYVEHDAGMGAGFADQEYELAGARIVYSPHEVFGRADLVLKISRPLTEEMEWLRTGSTVVGMLHLASARQNRIKMLLEKKITAIAYEQIQLPDGTLPVLKPMSQIGGRLVAQIAARFMQNDEGGKGIILGGIASVPPAEVVIIGAGIAGTCAAKALQSMGAHVTVLDTDVNALQDIFDNTCGVATMIANPYTIARSVAYADVVVGAVKIMGERAPIVITREMVKSMKERSMLIDISIDEGGCAETSRPTTHEHPTYIEEGVIHYCVPNIPSIVARTATYGFANAAAPYILEIVDKGIERAIATDPAIECAVNFYQGEVRHFSRLITSY